ncbi:MAG: GNAT family N-acetyltransferase [Planctomycetota bacterium]|jgi:ribosomal protein S18 acetylase RimI-like enzyme
MSGLRGNGRSGGATPEERDGGLVLRSGYGADRAKVDALNGLTRSIFGFDFEQWIGAGFRDDRYVPFSFFENEGVVSNVSLYSMDMAIDGERRRVAQICTCATRPEFRRRGLAGRLLQEALKSAEPDHDFVFLFADDEAIPFYRSHGFRPFSEFEAHVPAPRVEARSGRVRLDPGDPEDLKLIASIAVARAPVSQRFGVLCSKLLLFHCLYGLRDRIHYIPDLETIVLYERRDGRLSLYDVVSERVPSFAAFYPYLADERDEIVRFLFVPDRMELSRMQVVRQDGNNLHCLGRYPFADRRVMVPFTAQA